MVSLIVGVILPILVWIVILPFKLAVKIASKSMKEVTKQTLRKVDYISDLERQWNNSKAVKAGKATKFIVKWSYHIAKFGLTTSIKLLKVLIVATEWILHSVVIICTLGSFAYTFILVGSFVAVFAVVITVVGTSDTETVSGGGSSNQAPISGVNYMSIDWSKDFSNQLQHIEDSKGVEARNWVELTIIQMNTMQKGLSDGSIQFGVSGFMTGLKAVESGQNSLASRKGMTTQEVRLSNGTSPMQFDTNWQDYNPYYTNYSRSSVGSKFYYPDAFYGISKRFSKAGTNGFRPDRTTPLYERAFKDMGVELTDEKLRFVRYVGNITNEYNAVFLENTGYVNGLTAEKSNDTVYVNAMVIIQFAELYGYEITDRTVNLVKSMYSTSHKDTNFQNWFYNKSHAIEGIYGMLGGSKNYPSDVNKSSNYGVVTENGESVNGSLFNYLVGKMPETAKNATLSSAGLKTYNASRSHYMRARYDLTAYLLGVYDLWWSVENLGLSAELSK